MVHVESIAKSFNDIHACKDISFKVQGGELFGLIGPDGAGKTTLFRILTTLILPDSGTAFVDSFDVINEYRTIRSIIGYMPGRFSLYQDLSVEENLDFFATVFGTSVKQNYFLIRDIYSHIEPFKKRPAGKLSGGMKQKLALCCALIHRPKVLILDEPTTGVDAVSRTEFWLILRGLQKQGITIIVSTPYMDEAKQCDRVALIQNGTIISINTPNAITSDFDKLIYTVKGSNKYKLITDLRLCPSIESAHPFGESIHITLTNTCENISIVEKWLFDHNHSHIVIRQTTAGIEDFFLQWSTSSAPGHKD